MSLEIDTNENPIRAEKRRKLHELKAQNYDPYPHNFERTSTIAPIKEQFSDLETGEKKETSVYRLAGRLMTKRPMGKAAFFNIQDQSGNIQCYLRRDELSEHDKVAYDLMDLGDIIGVEGFVFKT